MGCVGSRVDIEADGRQYHEIKQIASGGFSQIILAEDVSSGRKVAVKRIACHSKLEVGRVRQEIQMHRMFGNEKHIIPLLGVQEEEMLSSGSRFSLVFPLCKLGSVQDELTHRRPTKDYMSQDRVVRLFRQMVAAVQVMHRSSPPFAHRDIKPANFLFDGSDSVLLIDFGSVTQCPIKIDDARQSQIMMDEVAELCSMPYRAPELFTCEIGSTIDQSIDIWSLGCVLYALAYFCSPFDEVYEKGDSIALAAQSARLKFDSKAPFDQSVVDLIQSLIKVYPSERPTVDAVIEQLNVNFV